MDITRNDRVRMERAHVHAWPALQTANIDGWLWRASGGGSQRANSVSTVDFTGNNLDHAIDAVERRYCTCGEPARFQTFDETNPPDLANRLRQRGYRQSQPTITMFRATEPIAPPAGVEHQHQVFPAWAHVYLGAITENRRAVNARILHQVPAPRAFFAYRGIATALCVVSFRCAVIECVATHADARRQGAARTVLAALLAWAGEQDTDLIGLQVVADNTPAIRLYETLGFVAGATNRFWVIPT
jgi:ribosomal protein S18 acetylase RimI-like enzyme